MKLQGKTVLITGAGRGIGRGIALRLAADGADVVINDVNKENANKVAKEIQDLGRKSFAVVADVTNSSQVNAMVDKVVAEFGKLDVMINNAGIAHIKATVELEEADWDRTLAGNLKGTFLGAKAAAKQMIKQKSGKIINAASIAGHMGFPFLSHYTASKYGVIGFTQALAKELGGHGITVNAYCPGIVGTDMWELVDEEMGKYLGLPKGETVKKFCNDLIVLGGKIETPEDVACLVSYLASSDADYMTGQAINICGGICMS